MSSNNIYCVYLTTYFGNKLPMFYIGSTSISKIDRGYKGSVSSEKYSAIWKKEIVQNPELFKITILSTYTNRKEAFDKEEFLQRRLDVIKNPLYVNMSFANGGFNNLGLKFSKEVNLKKSINGKGKQLGKAVALDVSTGKSLGKISLSDARWKTGEVISISKNRKFTYEQKLKISQNHADVSGENNPRFGAVLTEETKTKISKANLGKTRNAKQKETISKLSKDRKWINNGLNSKFVKAEDFEILLKSGWAIGRCKNDCKSISNGKNN